MTNVAIVDTALYQLVTPEATQHVHVFISKTSQGERTRPDAQIENTWRTVRNASNTAIAPYHYLWRSTAADSGKKQAQAFANIVTNLVNTQGGKISDMSWHGAPLVWLDVDPVKPSLGEPAISQNQMENLIWKFINNVRLLLGAAVGIYTSEYAWTDVTGPGKNRITDIPYDRPLWVSNPGSITPAIPWDWEKRYGPDYYDLWQYSFTGKVPGIMKPNTPSVQAAVDLDRPKVDNLAWFNARFGTELTVKQPGQPPVEPPPVVMPTRIEIEMANAERLNIREWPFEKIVAQTWDGVQFPVIGSAKDGQRREWWQVGPEMYVASWYCKVIQ